MTKEDPKKNPPGRPFGWRKPHARRLTIMLRVTKEELAILRRAARRRDLTLSDVLREAISKVIKS